ncbi:hypothetical protein [Enterovibrio norvegicus]|uniref:hypothetical protein n=1 Tax=Enterovibrio norvegicus TaxID=188144 RepID=UPI0010BF31D3|nr:hypothetical protein [Enterovibrio norvegicus]TKF31298.1 hypothetical protein FCV83_16510 [Enterovibrio norvegicus]
MKQQPFEYRLANSLNNPTCKRKQIKKSVLQHCVNAGFIREVEKDNESLRYKWLMEVLDINLTSLSLLDQITVDSNYSLTPADVQTEIDAKVSAVVKNIVKRLMETAVAYPCLNCESIARDSQQKPELK